MINRLIQAVDFLSSIMLESNLNCHFNGDLPCAWGGAHALRALSEVPEGDRLKKTREAIDKMPVQLVKQKDPSKWITWQALYVLKEASRYELQ